MKKILIILFVLISQHVVSQYKPDSIQPEVGKPLPGFVLDNVKYYTKSKVSSEDFKGKWLILDFWYRGCLACIHSFPRTNDLQERFKEKVQFILVGANDKMAFGKGIEELYDRLRKKMNLQLTAVFDSTLVQRWGIRRFPSVIIVDPRGVTRHITFGGDMIADKVQDMLDGKEVSFEKKEMPGYDPESVTNSTEQLVFRSVLTKWNGEAQSIGSLASPWYEANGKRYVGYNASMVQLFRLYNLAYIGEFDWSSPDDSLYGKIYPYPVLEIKDSSFFKEDRAIPGWKGQNFYNYNLSSTATPPNSKNYVMQVLRNELKNSFGYEVTIEKRSMPVWRFIATPEAEKKLKTKGGTPGSPDMGEGDGGAGGYSYRNWPIGILFNSIIRFLGESTNVPPFFDETGITYNIDITMDALMIDKAAVIKELKRNGLDLVRGEKEMYVMVIRDPK